MTTPAHIISAAGGVAATHELYSAGSTRFDISAAVASRAIVRVRQGWYSLPTVHPTVREALRVGGRLTCISSLRLGGVWCYPHPRELHVSVPLNACRLRSPKNMRVRLAADRQVEVHWRDSATGSRLMLSPLQSLRDAAACLPTHAAFAVADSLLHNFRVPTKTWQAFLSTLPVDRRAVIARADGICESGTESLFWLRLGKLAHLIRRQVWVEAVGRVDFLIGDRLIVEVDGAEYHTSPEQFERDRRRDALLSALGYRVLRFSYRQVLYDWPSVEAAVIAALIRGDHH